MGRLLVAALALALLATASVAHAARPSKAVRDSIEASMLVTGTIEVDPSGRVERYEVDKRDALPRYVLQLLDQAVPSWRFEPTLDDGKPAHVKTSMRVRVAATKQGEDAVVLRISGASFGGIDRNDAQAARDRESRRNHPPRYPRAALRLGVMATVYLVGRVDFDGTMQEVVAEQVNLRYLGSERVLDELRKEFAQASRRAAMHWTFAVPEDVDRSKAYWSVRVPVDFTINDFELPGYGEWDSYIPGPRTTAWWIEDGSHGGDSYIAGGVYPVADGLKLLTPLEGNG